MKRLVPGIILITICRLVLGQSIVQTTEAQDEAIESAITDFLTCRLSKKNNVFSVSI
ncbi:MAG: hypothetical protein LBR65_01830 [Culturomica sp.]|jgi:hypothetical protein|nr:hypothetical protein [Culturomica sp.]